MFKRVVHYFFEEIEVPQLAWLVYFVVLRRKPGFVVKILNLFCSGVGTVKIEKQGHYGSPSSPLSMVAMHNHHILLIIFIKLQLPLSMDAA